MHRQIELVIALAAARALIDGGRWELDGELIEHVSARGRRDVMEVAADKEAETWADCYKKLGLDHTLTHDDHGYSRLYSFLGAATFMSQRRMDMLKREQPHNTEWFDLIKEIRQHLLKTFGLPEGA